jgi:NADH-quinone oxidoreductase subunit C
MTQKLDTLQAALESALGDASRAWCAPRRDHAHRGADRLPRGGAHAARRSPLRFEQLIDLCGVDYCDYKNQPWDGLRYCVVSHLLSVTHNWRLRLKVFAPDDDLPVVASLTDVWSRPTGSSARPSTCTASSSRATRPAPHPHRLRLHRPPDAQGLPGHRPRRDALRRREKRVIYQPVTIEPREITPRVVREDNYGGLH